MEGQLTVYNYKGGPCYRCLYPQPPPPETVNNCSDAGVLGVVPGVIGVLQALEAIKVLLGHNGTLGSRLLLFDGSDTQFRNVKLRSKNGDCVVCGTSPTITELIDYVEFCGSSPNDKDKGIKLLNDERITAQELARKMKSDEKFVLLDVRSNSEFEICALPDSVNVPLSIAEKEIGLDMIKEQIVKIQHSSDHERISVYVLCRRGNDSQKAVRLLNSKLQDLSLNIKDVKGGLHSWTHTVDDTFPIY
ncbi:adenylyltransferase and sulfurtransferase MOCS3-like [Lycorma delicatula]|uniref:adenylyltransferase and sulfurtransferase MOCS3-like n=1 Tax=Lycorma delicatula TaxID=130591 RepID=UPI003F516AC1